MAPAEPITVTVQSRREAEDFWLVWVDHRLAGSVHSEEELDETIAGLGPSAVRVVYEPGARDDLDAGPRPPGSKR